MGRREEIDRLQQIAYDSEDLPTLESAHKQAVEMLSSINANIALATDADVRELLLELKSQAEDAEQELKRRATEIRVEMMDPNFASRQAEKQRQQAEEKAREEAMRKKFETEGIGGLFKGLGEVFGGLAGTATAAPAQATAAASLPATGAKCPSCGSVLNGSPKFCPDCGTPVPRERLCSGCNAKLEHNVKFCPECGTKAV